MSFRGRRRYDGRSAVWTVSDWSKTIASPAATNWADGEAIGATTVAAAAATDWANGETVATVYRAADRAGVRSVDEAVYYINTKYIFW